MKKEKYAFVTKWVIEAPIEKVWDAIYESTEWPQWWKGVLKVDVIEKGQPNGIDGVRAYTWKSALPYKLTFHMKLTQREDNKLLGGVAFGELDGDGIWIFEQSDSIVTVHYYWNAHTNKKWMNWFAFILKPAFKYNHDIVMRWGADGLAKKLNAKLISC